MNETKTKQKPRHQDINQNNKYQKIDTARSDITGLLGEGKSFPAI